MMAAQFKAFMDATGGLWKTQQLAGKPAGIFYSTSSQGGGHETTALTAITQLVHHGMVFVPIGYTSGAGMLRWKKYLVLRNAFFLCQFWPVISHRAALCIAKVFTRSKSHLLHQLTSFGRGLFFSAGCVMIAAGFLTYDMPLLFVILPKLCWLLRLAAPGGAQVCEFHA
ncbi:hypothetical protein KIW84_025491 [Lathyrus oleraceus]|uniref:NAD(P)H dehydrogenase (quinone) n=1 Tax=Pisum sativum TaxID=3888 RepID=A0A9D4YM01_PEA|nr:hypothetical protein KIW84_025491 [Pisum sativum]